MSCPDKPLITKLANEVRISFKENGKLLTKSFKVEHTLNLIEIYERSVGCIDYLVFRWDKMNTWVIDKKQVESIDIDKEHVQVNRFK